MAVNWTLQNDVLIIEGETPEILSYDYNDPPLSSWRLKKGLLINGFLPEVLTGAATLPAFVGNKAIKNMYIGDQSVIGIIVGNS